MDIKIGDKVRFLNEVGGGVVSGFQGKDIVLVEDEDGFDIPMLKSQVVVIDTNENNFVRKTTPKLSPAAATHNTQTNMTGAVTRPSVKGALAEAANEADNMPDTDPADSPVAFKAKPIERKEGDRLNIYLGFIPENVKELTSTRFEAYVVNDSNYYLSLLFANSEGAAWHARWQGIIEPNKKVLLETFDRSQLNDLERLAIQCIAWKQDKTFALKPAVNVELRLDLVKFYKLHVFQPSPFFREPALLYDIVRNDQPIRQVFVDAKEVLDAISGGEEDEVEEGSGVTPQDEHPIRKQTREDLKRAKAEYRQSQRHLGKNVLEVDLHISALLDNTAGLSSAVLLNTQLTEFRTVMDRYIKKKGQQIVFIHGKGEGVLREAIVKELQRRYRTCTWQDASFREYGFGATLVTIK